jgi:hypothetical protein
MMLDVFAQVVVVVVVVVVLIVVVVVVVVVVGVYNPSRGRSNGITVRLRARLHHAEGFAATHELARCDSTQRDSFRSSQRWYCNNCVSQTC